MELIFLRPGENERAARDWLQQLLEEPGLVRIAVAYFTDRELADGIVERRRRGLQTQVLFNAADMIRPIDASSSNLVVAQALIRIIKEAKWPSPLEARSIGGQRREPKRFETMHHKFAVTERQVLFGTLNWTFTALKSNYELIGRSFDPADVATFQREFQHLWDHAGNIEVHGDRLRAIVCPVCRRGDSIDLISYGSFCTNCLHEFHVFEER